MIPANVLKLLPKSNLVTIRVTSRWCVSRFRLANAIRWQFGRIELVHRAPWLEHSARQLYPHLFGEKP